MYKVGFYEICLVTSSFVKPWCVTLLKVKTFLRYFLLCSLFFCNPPTFSVLPFRCHKWREEFSLVSGSESDKYSVFSGKSLIVAVKNVQNHLSTTNPIIQSRRCQLWFIPSPFPSAIIFLKLVFVNM